MSFHPFRKEAAARLGATIAQLRKDLELPELAWYLSQQPPTDHESVNGVDVVADIAALAAADPFIHHLPTPELPPQDRQLVLDTAAIVELGRSLGERVAELDRAGRR